MSKYLFAGVVNGSPEEMAALGCSAKFFWEPSGTPDESEMQGFLATLDEYRARGGKYFFVNRLEPNGPEFYAERVVNGKKEKALKYPYTFHGPIAELFLHRVRRAAAWKLPVIHNFVPDEIYYANAHIPYTFGVPVPEDDTYLCSSPEVRAAFSRETGLELPQVTRSRLLKRNTREARQFILFRYRTLADTLKQWQRVAREVNPEIKTYAMLNLRAVYGLERYPGGLALDLLGPDAGFDYIAATSFQCSYDWRGPDTHYFIPETIKHLRAGLPKAKVFAFTSAFRWLPDSSAAKGLLPLEEFAPLRQLCYYGTAISSIAHGADGFMSLRGGTPEECTPKIWEAQKKAYGAFAAIRSWIEGAAPPRDIAFLYSRAGEDFYGLAHEEASLDPEQDGSEHMLRTEHVQQKNYISYHLLKEKEQARGFLAHKRVMHFLFKNGYPFDMFYLDTLAPAQIEPYRVLVLPFAHAISEQAAAMLKEAVAAGKKVVLFDNLGALDQEGEPHETPLLAELVGRAGVVHLPGDDNVRAAEPATSARIRQALDSLLGEERAFALLEKSGEIEAALLEKSASDKTVFLLNWENRPATATVRLSLPEGAYKITQRDLNATSSFATGGRTEFTHADLQSLSLQLAPEGVLVLHIAPCGEHTSYRNVSEEGTAANAANSGLEKAV